MGLREWVMHVWDYSDKDIIAEQGVKQVTSDGPFNTAAYTMIITRLPRE